MVLHAGWVERGIANVEQMSKVQEIKHLIFKLLLVQVSLTSTGVYLQSSINNSCNLHTKKLAAFLS